jgi:hypothetical protein
MPKDRFTGWYEQFTAVVGWLADRQWHLGAGTEPGGISVAASINQFSHLVNHHFKLIIQ